MIRKCEVCGKEVANGEGVTVVTDKLNGKCRYHKECFDEVWDIYRTHMDSLQEVQAFNMAQDQQCDIDELLRALGREVEADG